MTPLLQLWMASGVGAALFFAVGFVLARAMHRAEQGLGEAYLVRLNTQLEHMQSAYAAQGHEVDHLDHRAQRAEQSARELSDALAHARAECVRLDKELAERVPAAERSSVLELENRRLQEQMRTLESVRPAASMTPDLQRQLRELRQRNAETAKARAQWEARALALETNAQRAQASAEEQTTALSRELERLRQEQRESGQRVRVLSTRAARLDSQEQENAHLKKQCEALSDELYRLRQGTVSDASALRPSVPPVSGRQLVLQPPPRIAAGGRTLEPGAATERGLEAILERQLSMLMVREPGVTAVLSDAHGLPLVGLGSGRDQECVAVLTSLARDLAARTRELVGFERVEAMELVEGGGRALRVRFFDWADQPLALGYLGARLLLQADAEERMVSSFPPLRVVHSA